MSVVEAVIAWVPFENERVFHDSVYGDEAMGDPKGTPSSRNWMEETPTVEVGLAARVTVLVTVAPFAGEVTETETPVALIVKDTGRLWGEPVAPDAEIVAVALYVPRASVAGFTMKETVVLAPPARELDAGLNVSHV
jgi:hypothetical protein